MENTCPFNIIFQLLKVLLKICKIEPPDLLFIVVFMKLLYHQQISFFTNLYSTLYLRKRFLSQIFLF